MAAPACAEDAKALQFIEEITQNADAVQENVLAQILTQNAQTEYLKGFNLGGATDRQTFKSKIPMVTYEDLRPLIRRIADGDRSPILTAHPISELLISSGCSDGEPKLIPIIKEELDRRKLFYSLLTPVINRYIEGLDKGKALFFRFTKAEMKTQGGVVARPVSTSFFKNFLFKTRLDDLYNVYTSPDEAILCVDMFQSMYTQMLCGLCKREQVMRIGTAFVTGLLQAIRFLQLNWQELTHDIRTGSLNPKVKDASIRESMTRVVRPDPDLADFIARECEKNDWEGIIIRLWPNTKLLQVVVTGTMSQYVPILDYYSGGLPKASMLYTSSECFIGINLNPICQLSEISYSIMPNMAYFELLPHQSSNSSSSLSTHKDLVDLADVEIDKEYELVITTFTGLYRYRIGDILRVTGFYNSTPQFQFVRRKNVLLSVDVDATNEVELQAAMESASQLLHEFDTRVIEYTSYADTTTVPGHYVLYWELSAYDSKNSSGDKVLEQCCLAMEESFNSIYRLIRVAHNTIGPLEIRIVKNGTFDRLMEYAVSRGASITQYKVPKCISSKPMVNLLDSQVMSAHFSPSLPTRPEIN